MIALIVKTNTGVEIRIVQFELRAKKANDERGKRRRVGVRRLRSQKDPRANTLELDSPTNLNREW
jgi:hypothetical protein